VVALLTVGANELLGVALAGEADRVLRARAEAVGGDPCSRPATGGAGCRRPGRRRARRRDVDLAAGGTVVETPPGSSGEADRAAAGLAARTDAVETVDVELPDRTRLLALPVREGADRIATVVTSTSLTPYDKLERLAGIGSAVLGGCSWWWCTWSCGANVRRALRPCTR
jgi:hypothetical protein